MSNTPALAIDYGERHVGLAMTSSEGTATRHSTIEWDGQDQSVLIGMLLATIETEKAGNIVVGVPRNLEGELTEQSALITDFAAALQKALPEGTSVTTVDETLTSAEAQQRLAEEGAPASDEHAEAAKIILEDYLRQQADK
ncbi:Holliday junction resolvase RuvX [bacterium]|nr:Holliday junction resolvase RuvX [bacterium]